MKVDINYQTSVICEYLSLVRMDLNHYDSNAYKDATITAALGVIGGCPKTDFFTSD